MSCKKDMARDTYRVFLGFRLPADAARALARWQGDLGTPRGVRLVPLDNLHVTIAFLGGRPAAELDAIAGALRESAEGASQPALTAVRYRETRSVGMVVFDDEDQRATRVAEGVQQRLERLGLYEREKRPWLPHVTVLRFRERPRLAPPTPDLGVVNPSEAAVYHSVLRRTGAQYEVLESVALGG